MRSFYLLFLSVFIFHIATKVNPNLDRSNFIKGIILVISTLILITSIICFIIGV